MRNNLEGREVKDMMDKETEGRKCSRCFFFVFFKSSFTSAVDLNKLLRGTSDSILDATSIF